MSSPPRVGLCRGAVRQRPACRTAPPKAPRPAAARGVWFAQVTYNRNPARCRTAAWRRLPFDPSRERIVALETTATTQAGFRNCCVRRRPLAARAVTAGRQRARPWEHSRRTPTFYTLKRSEPYRKRTIGKETSLTLPTLTNTKLAVLGLGYVGLPLAVPFTKKQIDSERKDIDRSAATIVNGAETLRGVTKTRSWSTEHELYVHVYYNDVRSTATKNHLYGRVRQLVQDAQKDPRNGKLKEQFDRYLIIRKSEKHDSGYTVNVRRILFPMTKRRRDIYHAFGVALPV